MAKNRFLSGRATSGADLEEDRADSAAKRSRFEESAALNRVKSLADRGVAACGRRLKAVGIEQPRDVVPVARQTYGGWQRAYDDLALVAATIRIGIGILFIVGGWNKLSKLLSPSASDGLVASYTSTTGYINEFFMTWLFGPGSFITPWSFLTTLSAFELISGVMLVVGLLVRPLALIYAFLLWTFVVALPVVTTNGIDPGVKTYMAPAALVQVRDIALSGIMFALYLLGSGVRSLDVRIFGPAAAEALGSKDVIGLLLRLSLALVFIVGGLFAGMTSIKAFLEPGFILFAIGVALLFGGRVTQVAAAAACAVLIIYMASKVGISKGMVGSLNAVKREIALLAVAVVVMLRGSGVLWTASDIWRRMAEGARDARSNLGAGLGTTAGEGIRRQAGTGSAAGE